MLVFGIVKLSISVFLCIYLNNKPLITCLIIFKDPPRSDRTRCTRCFIAGGPAVQTWMPNYIRSCILQYSDKIVENTLTWLTSNIILSISCSVNRPPESLLRYWASSSKSSDSCWNKKVFALQLCCRYNTNKEFAFYVPWIYIANKHRVHQLRTLTAVVTGCIHIILSNYNSAHVSTCVHEVFRYHAHCCKVFKNVQLHPCALLQISS